MRPNPTRRIIRRFDFCGGCCRSRTNTKASTSLSGVRANSSPPLSSSSSFSIESTDLVFAIDSIPAIFAVTDDPFIVYTSNVFAILGLRALYFLIAGVLDMFVYLRIGLGVVLGFVGVKMLLVDVYPIPIGLSLGVIAFVLTATIMASLLFPPTESEGPAQPKEDTSEAV